MNDQYSTVFPELKTDRLILRSLSEEDAETIFFLRTDPDVNKYIPRKPMNGLTEAKKFISDCNNNFKKGSLFQWGITLKENNSLIGSICLWNISKDKRKAEIGYNLMPEQYQKGYMTEAMEKIIDFGFQHVCLNLIEAYTERENISSIRLLEKNGFIHDPSRSDEENPKNDIYLLSNQL
jgi:ribosomal-protein-alanine N-acetyltransferase